MTGSGRRNGAGPDAWAGLFRLLVRLYPRRFREAFGDDMIASFRVERRRVRREHGAFRALAWTMGTVAATVWGVALEWWLHTGSRHRIRRTADEYGRGHDDRFRARRGAGPLLHPRRTSPRSRRA